MGSLYRSQHELVFVFKNGMRPHINNVELGRFGRNRTNIWNYAGASSFGSTRDSELAMHPTVKPLSLVAGSAELPLLRKQTADFAGHRAQYGLPVTYEEIPGANHFTIMNELVSPAGRITTLIRQLFERTAATSS